MWTLIVFLIILKIPIVYVCWVVWWAIKSEPEVGTEGGNEGVNWKPWRGSPRSRPPRGGPHGRRRRRGERVVRTQQDRARS